MPTRPPLLLTRVVALSFLLLALGACFRTSEFPMHLVPDASDEEAAACYDRCVAWTQPGSSREDCVAGCPSMRVFAGRCGARRDRCVDVVRTEVHLDEEATVAALRVTAEAVRLAAEIHAEQQERDAKKKRERRAKPRP